MKNIIDNKIKKFSSRILFLTENHKITYKKLLINCEKKINFINSGDLILVVASNSLDFFELYFYALKNNIPQILIDQNTDEESIKKIIKAYKPNYVFLRNKLLKTKISPVKLDFNNYYVYHFSKKKIEINNNLALLLSTSGSTGSSKFVKLSLENIFDNAKNIVKYLKIKKEHTTITTMLPSYSYGLSIINSHFISGAKIVINGNNLFEKLFWKKLVLNKVTSFGGVPFQYEFLKKLKFENMNLKHLKYLTQAGGSLNKNELTYLLKICQIKKIKFIQMYGQTEASPRISYLPFSKAKNKIGSIGIPIPGGSMALKKTKNSKIGEILYKGKNVFIGYSLGYSDLKEKVNKNKILKTGDMGWKDKDGYYFLSGRKNRFTKIAGFRINLDDIKEVLRKEHINAELADHNKKIIIFFVSDHTKDEILDKIFKKFRLNKNFFRIFKIKYFPRNKRNKIDLNTLIKNETY